jgi:hypothetical protein
VNFNRRRRRAGTAINIVVISCVIFLVVSVMIYQLQKAQQIISDKTTSTTTSGGTNGTSTTAAAAHLRNITLADLRNLSFANASKCDGYHDKAFWNTTMTTSGNVTSNMVPNTVYSLYGETNEWTTLFRNNQAPAWMSLGLGNYTDNFVATIAAKFMGTDNVTKAAAVMKNITSTIGGMSTTGLDFISFGLLKGEVVQLTTHNSTLAWSVTFPGQLYLAYQLAFDCQYSEQQRAQFLGTALAMTALLIATSGRDGFGPKFEAMLDELGLRDAWAGIKGNVKDIADKSPGAAYQTMMVLSALAKKFPSDKFPNTASFTSKRIANMVQVLKDQGYSPDDIQQKVADFNRAVDESSDEWHVADIADSISYQADGFLMVTIDNERGVALYSQGGQRSITASFVALILPDFKVGEITALKVTVHKFWYKLDTQLRSYEVYQGGKYVEFVLPKEEVQPGDEVGLSFEVLPVEDFVGSVGQFTLTAPPGVRWVADGELLNDFKVQDGVLQFRALQTNRWSSVGDFPIRGQIVKYPGVTKQGGIYAEFAITDYAGRTKDLRLLYDGFSFEGGSLKIVIGDVGRPVSLISYDGFRLKIVYASHSDADVATIYLDPPSEAIYSQSVKHPYSGPYLKLVEGKYTNAWQIDSVVMPRDLEKSMLSDGGTYALGRLGSENAYVTSDTQLGLKNIIIEEPSQGGRDLYTLDNTVAVQARIVVHISPDKLEKTIQTQLLSLVNKLKED